MAVLEQTTGACALSFPNWSGPKTHQVSKSKCFTCFEMRSKNIRSEHTQILKTQTSLTARSHSLREKAAAYVDYLAAFLAAGHVFSGICFDIHLSASGFDSDHLWADTV